MARKGITKGYSVVAHIQQGDYNNALKEAENAKRLIEHHLSPHCPLDVVYLSPDVEGRCEFCGRLWSEDGSTYNGGCCLDDAKQGVDDD